MDWKSFLEKHEREIVSIYRMDEDTDTFRAGRVIVTDDENVVISQVSEYGDYDGFYLMSVANIARIEYGGKYEKYLLALNQLKKSKCVMTTFTGDIKEHLINYACDNQLVVTLELDESGMEDVQGLITAVSETVTVSQLDNYGAENGISILSLESITTIQCDSQKEQCLKIISQQK